MNITPTLDAIAATDRELRLLIKPPGGEDMRRFTALTHGRRCIVGSKTYEDVKGLKHREFVRATRSLEHQPGDLVIGGAEIYKSYWPLVRRVYISRFDNPLNPDAVGEPFDLSEFAQEVVRTADDHSFQIWVRKGS